MFYLIARITLGGKKTLDFTKKINTVSSFIKIVFFSPIRGKWKNKKSVGFMLPEHVFRRIRYTFLDQQQNIFHISRWKYNLGFLFASSFASLLVLGLFLYMFMWCSGDYVCARFFVNMSFLDLDSCQPQLLLILIACYLLIVCICVVCRSAGREKNKYGECVCIEKLFHLSTDFWTCSYSIPSDLSL